MEQINGAVVRKSFRCFSHKSLKLSLPRSLSKSSSNVNSPRTPKTHTTPTKSLPNSREDEFMEVFRRFDSDNDGKISATELRCYFGSIGEYMSHEQAQDVINELDSDGDNMIDFKDFLNLMKNENNGDDDLKAAFEMFEYEKGCGRITPKSLQRLLNRLGDIKSYDECVAMIQVYDIDGNGELDYNEFQHMMTA